MSYNAELRSNNMIRNYDGAKAWMMTHEFELYSAVVCTMSMGDKFYEKSADRINRITSLVRMVSAEFVAQLAIYARTEMHLRSVPMLLLVELSKCHSGDSLVSRATAQTIQRVDDITELLACYQWRHRSHDLKHLSNQLRKGIAEAFNKFDEYQFAKYNRDHTMVRLRDALFLVHPKAKDAAQQIIFDKIAHDQLEVPYTWETQMSQTGQTKGLSKSMRRRLKRNTWKELIESRRMGYMAMLRNLRNMLLCGLDDDTMRTVYDYLSDEQAVKQSKQLPFRFLSAYLKLNDYSWLTMQTRWREMFTEDVRDQLSELEHRKCLVRKRKTCRKRPKVRQSVLIAALRKSHLVQIDGTTKGHSWHVSHTHSRLIEATRTSHRLQRYMDYLKALEKSMTESLHASPLYKACDCLETAVKHSASSIPAFSADTRVCIACDTSFSMTQRVNKNSYMKCHFLALFFGAMMKYRCANAVVGMFADSWLPLDMPQDNIMQNVMKMRDLTGQVGYSTNAHKVIEWLIRERKVMDKVMFFTDCQLWNSEIWDGETLQHAWKTYKKNVAPNAKLYLFDLAGYGHCPIDMDARNDVYCIAGWSDKVFDMLAAIENGKSVIDEIRRIAV